jgi:FKBP-type peptidyl-prolyl cis-trans isomerase FkpA
MGFTRILALTQLATVAIHKIPMNNNKPMQSGRVLLSIATLAAGPLFAAEEAEPAPPTPPSPSSAFEAMGFAMGSQLRLNIGFSDEELDSIFSGMRIAAQNGDQPEGFQTGIQIAQQIYMQRMQTFQAAEQERMAEVSAENQKEADAFFAELDNIEGIQKTESGLYYEILTEGEGAKPTDMSSVVVDYKGTLIDGREFDSGTDARMMVGGVVPGFAEGLKLIPAGGSAKLYIPSDLAYGDNPSRPGSIIEPGDALIFEVAVKEVREIPPPPTGPPPSLPPNLPPPPPPPSGPPPGPPPSGPPPGVPGSN